MPDSAYYLISCESLSKRLLSSLEFNLSKVLHICKSKICKLIPKLDFYKDLLYLQLKLSPD